MDLHLLDNKINEVLFKEHTYTTVEQIIAPYHLGRVHFEGSHWFAKFRRKYSYLSASPGSLVKVVGRQGITLIVEPVSFDRKEIDVA